VFPVDTSRIATRQEEERGRTVDHYAPGMCASFGNPRAIFDVEPETNETRHLLAESRSIILAPASLGESQGLGTVSVPVHHTLGRLTIRHGVRLVMLADKLNGS
jgi:hypothetical protein